MTLSDAIQGPWLFALGTFLMTLAGGVVALRISRHLQWISAFTSGLLVAVALLNLLPEAFHLAHGSGLDESGHLSLLELCALGFVFFYLLDLVVPEHHAQGHEDHRHAPAQPRVVGLVGASVLCLHSLTDGLLIGASSHTSSHVAHAVGVAVLLHNFADGVSTVSMMLRNGQPPWRTRLFIAVVALCPTLGLGLATTKVVELGNPSMLLALFAGAFLYLGGSHLSIREHGEAKKYAPLATALGFLVVFLARSR